jgi:probable addiction module antidote protein
MASKLTRIFDASEYLTDDESIRGYLDEAFSTGDPKDIVEAIGVIARAIGMTRIAAQTGLSRESLYKALTEDGNPAFATVIKVLGAMNISLTTEKEPHANAAQ